MNNSTLRSLLVFFMLMPAFALYAQEPSNYPTSFSASTLDGSSIKLTWTGSSGGTVPSNYVILARVVGVGTFTAPTDNASVAEDLDLSDVAGLGAHNVAHSSGSNSYTWTSLPTDQDYEFIIYPYKTGGGPPDPDYKTSGSPPTATASTKRPTVTSPTVTGISTGGSSTATIGGNVTSNNGNTLTERGTVWSTTTPVTIADNQASVSGTGTGTFTDTRTFPSGVKIYFAAYAINVAGTSLSPESSFYTPSATPGSQAGSITATAVSASEIDLSFPDAATLGNAVGYIILRRQDGTDPTSTGVTDAKAVLEQTSLPSGTTLVDSVGTGVTSYANTGLSATTQYRYTILPYNWDGAHKETHNYRTSGTLPTAAATTFAAVPSGHASSFDAIATSGTQINLTFSSITAAGITNADGYIILRRSDGAFPDGTGVVGGKQPGALTLPSGTTLVTTINSTSTNSFNNTGLSNNTTYTYALIPFNWDGSNNSTYNYLTSPTIPTASDATSNGVIVTPANTTSVCQGNSITLSDIEIAEVGKADFNTSGTILLELDNPAYSFIPSQGTVSVNPSSSTNNDIDAISMVVNASRITITYTLDGSNDKKESIIISGVKVTYDGSSVSAAHMTKTGGTATINGGGSMGNLATINAGTSASSPVVSFPTSSYCQNDVISPGPSVTSNNTNVKWYTDASLTSEIVSLAGVTNINTPILLTQLGFTTTAAGSVTRYVTQTPGACQSLGVAVTLNVQSKPTADLLITSGSNALCTNYVDGVAQPDAVQFTASPSGGTNYKFLKNGVTILQNGSSRIYNANSTSFSTGDLVSVEVTVSGSCPSTSGTIPMTVNTANPSVDFVLTYPPANSPNNVMVFSNQQDTVRLTGTPAGGVFSGPGMFGSFIRPSGLPIGSYTGTYTVTTSGCTSKKNRPVTIYDGSNSILGLNSSYCSTDADFVMDDVNNSFPGTTFLYILPLSHYFNPLLPTGSVITNGPSNAGQQVTAANESNWFKGFATTSSPFIISPSKITSNPALASNNAVVVQFYAVYKNNSTLATETRLQNVTFTIAPSAPAVSLSPSYCVSDNIIIDKVKVLNDPNTTVRWYVNSNYTGEITSSIPTADRITPTLGELGVTNGGSTRTVVRYVTQTLNGCESAPATVTINIYSNPAAPIAPSPAAYCAGTPIANLAATGSNIRWYNDTPVSTANQILPIANPNSAAAPELALTNTTAGTSLRYVTQTTNGCESLPTTVSVTINSIPTAPGSSFSHDYCLNATIPPSDLSISGGFTGIRWYSDPLLTSQIASGNNPTASQLGLVTTAPTTFSRYATQTALGCESPSITVTINILNLPSVSISTTADLMAICKSGKSIDLQGFPAGGNWSGTAVSAPGALIADIPAGTAVLNPGALDPDQSYTLRYDFSSSCANFDQKNLKTFPSVAPSLVVGNACNGQFVNLNNTSTILTNGTPATIDTIGWRFGDGDVLVDSIGNIPAGKNGGNTIGTYVNPKHIFRSLGVSQVKYSMKTSDGCVVEGSQNVVVTPVPNTSFTWSNSCSDPVSGSSTNFIASTTNIPNGSMHYTWKFNLKNTLTPGTVSTPGNGKVAMVSYQNTGMDSVRLIATSIYNCVDSAQKPVFIVPALAPLTENNSYVQDFNTGNGGWIAGGKNSSWQLGHPAGAVINRDSSSTGNGNAWDTNLSGNSNANEQSWVLSPCFDFSQTIKPVISLDIWSDSPRGIDGAVLQYNEVNDIEDDANWKVMGQVGQGVNWYDQNGISNKPGNQASGDAGWTGDALGGRYKGWRHAIYRLDELVGKPNVKFRIAFASGAGRQEGFAFDNIFIGERSRSVLIENFTNSATEANSKTQNDVFNAFGGSSIELVKVEFHTNFPGYDTLNRINIPMNNSRAAFYGITSAPTLRIDGKVGSGPLATWITDLYDQRVLDPSPVKIDIASPVKDGDVVKVNVSVTNTTSTPLDLKNANVFVVVVEKSITSQPWLGTGNNTEFKYVAKEILPTPSGVNIGQVLSSGASFNIPELTWSQRDLITSGQGALVVFVQDITGERGVYQAKFYDNPVEPDVITGVEPLFADQVVIYPNPADKNITVQLPSIARENVPVKMFDINGSEVYRGDFEKGQQTKLITTENMIGGVYLLQINSGGVVRRKVMILHP